MKHLTCLLCLMIFSCSSAGTSIRTDSNQPLEANIQPIRELRTLIFYDEHFTRRKAISLSETCSTNTLKETGISLRIVDCNYCPLPRIRSWGMIENAVWGLARHRRDYDIVVTLTEGDSSTVTASSTLFSLIFPTRHKDWGKDQGVIDNEYRRFITLKGFKEPLLRTGIYHAFIFKKSYLKPAIYSKDPGEFELEFIPFSPLKFLSLKLQSEILQNKSRDFNRKIK